MIRRRVLKLLGLSVALPLAGCWGSNYQWNQKLKLVVQTPQGEASASSVIHADFTYGQMPMTGNDMSGGYFGEAVVMRLPSGKYLFALLNNGQTNEYTRLLQTFKADLPNTRDAAFAAITKSRGAKPIPPKYYPLLVTFDDINDPKSVKLVNPEDLAATFGSGVALKSITLEVTDEVVTEGNVERVLGWLNAYKKQQFRLNGLKCVACPVQGSLQEMLGGSNFLVWRKS